VVPRSRAHFAGSISSRGEPKGAGLARHSGAGGENDKLVTWLEPALAAVARRAVGRGVATEFAGPVRKSSSRCTARGSYRAIHCRTAPC